MVDVILPFLIIGSDICELRLCVSPCLLCVQIITGCPLRLGEHIQRWERFPQLCQIFTGFSFFPLRSFPLGNKQ